MNLHATEPSIAMAAKEKHRDDITGLRAVAVLIVLLFHLQVGIFQGGFVGVDVFFVISGFLITGVLWRGREASESVVRDFFWFMYRRLQRLVPAAIVAVFLSSAVAAFLFSPTTLRNFAMSAISATTGWSNFWFASKSDYFSDSVRMLPLLHFWSLSVEWQFYLVWPFLIAIAWRLRKAIHPVWVIVAVGVASFALNLIYYNGDNRPQLYFYPWFRVFEFAIGAAGVWFVRWRYPPLLREIAGAAGLAIILLSAMLFESGSLPLPSYPALLPCFGAFLVIVSNSSIIGGRILSRPFMLWVGECSYSIYLAHWPLIILAEIGWLPRMEFAHQVGLLLASLSAGWLLHEYVERPFLPSRERKSAHSFNLIFAPAAVAVLAVAGHAYMTNGWPWRLGPAMQAVFASTRQPAVFPHPSCFVNGITGNYAADFGFERCMARTPGKQNVLLVGDSFAAYAWVGLAAHENMNVMLNAVTGCQPVIGAFRGFGKGCVARNTDIIENFERYRADQILLMGNWRDEQGEALATTLRFFREKGQSVTVIGPTLRFSKKLMDIVAAYNDVDKAQAAATRFIPPEMFDLDATYGSIARENGATYFSPVEHLCTGRTPATCTAIIDGKQLVSADEWHLLPSAAKMLFRDFQ